MECLFVFFLSMGNVTGRFVGTLIAKVGQKGIPVSIEPSKGTEMELKREARNDKKWESLRICEDTWRRLAKHSEIAICWRLWGT